MTDLSFREAIHTCKSPPSAYSIIIHKTCFSIKDSTYPMILAWLSCFNNSASWTASSILGPRAFRRFATNARPSDLRSTNSASPKLPRPSSRRSIYLFMSASRSSSGMNVNCLNTKELASCTTQAQVTDFVLTNVLFSIEGSDRPPVVVYYSSRKLIILFEICTTNWLRFNYLISIQLCVVFQSSRASIYPGQKHMKFISADFSFLGFFRYASQGLGL